MSMVFGYLYGRHKVARAGRFISETTEEQDGRKVLVRKYELLEEEIISEQPWMMDTAVGRVHVCVPEPLTSEIEKLAPAGFEVLWRSQPVKRRGRRRKIVEPPANAEANGKVENAVIVIEQDDDDDYGEEEFAVI